MTGHRLLAFLRELSATTTWTVVADDASGRWQLAGLTWQATVIVDPRRWLGVEFAAQDPETGKRVTYDIDTDLFDISQESQREQERRFGRGVGGRNVAAVQLFGIGDSEGRCKAFSSIPD